MEIKYNLLNLPSQITDQDDPAQYVVNRYSITGQKVSSLDQDGNGRIYVGSLVYDVQGTQVALESAPFRGGRFVAAQGASGARYALRYHVTDHLGSVRVVLDRDGNVLEQSDYYPFGKRWEDANSPNSTNRYRYNGKEVAADRLLDYGARYYSPGLGRWLSVDPLVELDHAVSGYAYVGNNPVRYIDPYGLWRETADGFETDDEDEIGDFLDKVRDGKLAQVVSAFDHLDYELWLIDIGFYDSPQGGGKGGAGGGGGAGPWAGGVMPDGIAAYLQVNLYYGIAQAKLVIDNMIDALMQFRYDGEAKGGKILILINDALIRQKKLNMYDIASLLRHEWQHVQDFLNNPAHASNPANEAYYERHALFIQLFDPNIGNWSPQFINSFSDMWNRWY